MARTQLIPVTGYLKKNSKKDFDRMRRDKGTISDSDLVRHIIEEAVKVWKEEKKKRKNSKL